MSEIHCNCSVDIDPGCCYIKMKSFDSIAKRDFKCCECRSMIKKGEKYHFFSGRMPDDPLKKIDIFRTCLPCEGIKRDYFPHGWCFENIYDAFYDCHGFYPNEIPEDEEDYL